MEPRRLAELLADRLAAIVPPRFEVEEATPVRATASRRSVSTDHLLFTVLVLSALLTACSAVAPAASHIGGEPRVQTAPRVLFPQPGPPLHWTRMTAPGLAYLVDFSAIACPATSYCLLAGSLWDNGVVSGDVATVMITRDHGRTWTSAHLPAGLEAVDDLSCGDRLHCLATAERFDADRHSQLYGELLPALIATGDGGRTWTMQPVASDVLRIGSLACPATGECGA
ncbi:MAG TPA: hypothetical protein VGS21_06890, partial [Acidimicrobiales bacterium]|nr:hypothetical protein [Acidimicrobiales bacterium]